ncbi:hypothetical protein [Actinoplanes sp. NPDC020271]|uniref:hypothetical protein n=1 Tax=Actinoplanes sp. NPDC020271 TaxID=3363896 RepID=UPI00379E2F5E
MLIEVSGPDGSGKSTLVDGIRARIRESGGISYERTLRSEGRVVLEMVENSTADAASRFSPREVEIAVLLDAVSQSAAELTKYQGASTTHVLVQQHRCALLARLHRRGLAGHPELLALLDHLTVPDLSLRLQVSGSTCMARIRNRRKGDGLLARASPEAEMSSLVRSFDAAALTLGYPQVPIDGERAADETLETAWRHVAELLVIPAIR